MPSGNVHPTAVDRWTRPSFRNAGPDPAAAASEGTALTHHLGIARSEAVLVGRPGGGVKHGHFALAQGTPQLGVRVLHFLCWVQVP